ncbi:hypothetical protein G9A89_012557 [Geosiphon pyriformis]|nr:hypothetical protein G9A89_012557 [Geosiphon pyriformis]
MNNLSVSENINEPTFTYEWTLKEFQHLYPLIRRNQIIYSEVFSSPATSVPSLWRLIIKPKIKKLFKLNPGQQNLYCKEELKPLAKMDRRKITLPHGVVVNNTGKHNFYCLNPEFDQNNSSDWDKVNIDFMIRVKIWNCNGARKYSAKTHKYKPVDSNFTKYFGENKLSDIEFSFKDGNTLKAHQFVLASRSIWFKRMLVGEWNASQRKIIQIDGVTFVTFRAILFYLYTEQMDRFFPRSHLAELYAEAYKNKLPQLAKLANRELIRNVDSKNWQTLFILGCNYEDEVLKNGALAFALKNWNEAVDEPRMRAIFNWGGMEGIAELIRARSMEICV